MPLTQTHAFADLLWEYRRAVGLTQEELAERSGVSARALRKLESGESHAPHKSTVALLAKALCLAGDKHVAFLAAARPAVPAAQPALPPLPDGTVTFLFADIDGFTRPPRHPHDRHPGVLSTYHALLRSVFGRYHGHAVDTPSGSFVAFARAPDAVAAAIAARRALAAADRPEGVTLHMRMGLLTGHPTLVGSHYAGPDAHQAARIAAAAHDGQVLLSETTAALVRRTAVEEGIWLRDLGVYILRGVPLPERLYQLVLRDETHLTGLPIDFPPLENLSRHASFVPLYLAPSLDRARKPQSHLLVPCMRRNLGCAEMCQTTSQLLSSQTAVEPIIAHAARQASCMRACQVCGDECQQQAQHGMTHCEICVEACRCCEQACNHILSALPT